MSIGEVLGRLQSEFPDLTISKLRFLEAEGLVEPRRAPSGYRKYTADHLDRLRFILTAQRDRYLPLRVIREHLQAAQSREPVIGLPPPPRRPALLSTAGHSATRAGAPAGELPRAEVGDVRLDRGQLAQRSGLDEAALADLERYSLLSAGPSGHYTSEALTVARIAAQLSQYGLEARHLRPYRAMADREVGLLAQLVAPLAHQRGPSGRASALETVHELAALCAQLHGALVRQGLREVVGP
jgi:DNA-binding transcriptional MerR regulator